MRTRSNSSRHRQINITLPAETLALIDRITKRGNRSDVIDVAIRHYVVTIVPAKLKRQLKEGAQKRARRDLQLAAQWFVIDKEAWPKPQK